MISSFQSLPDGYIQTYEINLAINRNLSFFLNIVGFFVIAFSFVPLVLYTRWVRPGFFSNTFTYDANLSTINALLILIVFVILSLMLHELIHGFFFWFFTRSKPVYALHLAYAYAAAPGWFIPVRRYWIISLAPLMLINIVGLLLIILVPLNWILLLVILVAFNTGGAVGDLWIMFHAFRASPACLVNDFGDGVIFFEPGEFW
jgi:hypothetical protein